MFKSNLAVFLITTGSCMAQTNQPATPLITIDPYTSIWSFGDELNGSPTRHWTGKPQPVNALIRVDGKTFRLMGVDEPERRVILPTAKEKDFQVAFTTSNPEADWFKVGYNSSGWKTGTAPFGTADRNDNMLKTGTNIDQEVWFRRVFHIDNPEVATLKLRALHDDDTQIYLNGVLIFGCEECYTGGYEIINTNGNAKSALKAGENVLAVYCKNRRGPGYIDVGLIDERPGVSSGLISNARQSGFEMKATQSSYHFEAGPLSVSLTFTAPLILEDPALLSRPVNYLTYSVRSNDGKPHQVEILNSVSGLIAVNDDSQQVVVRKSEANGLTAMSIGSFEQKVLGRQGDDVRIDWGHAYLAAGTTKVSSSGFGSPSFMESHFANSGRLVSPKLPSPSSAERTAMGLTFDLGRVSNTPVSVHSLIAYDDLFSVRYFGEDLRPWWNRDGKHTIIGEMAAAQKDIVSIMSKCSAVNRRIYDEALKAGGPRYAELCVLAYRQAIAAHKAVAAKDGRLLFFSKENFSNGSIGTVDITYPSAPLFLLYNPVFLKGMMEPIFYYSESGKWSKPFAAHDVGTYPLANGQTYGEDMPVEESGNMLILTYAICKTEKNIAYARKHWEVLKVWADYLKKEGFDPANQLCTDDFAGHLAHNANLSIKAILGLASFAKMAEALGDKKTSAEYLSIAKDFAAKWEKMANDGDHYSLTFDKKGTWSQKYNLIWDEILGLNIFPKSIAEKEIKYYLTKQQPFGLPLDSRRTYTKSDWIIWTASLAKSQADFKALIAPVAAFVRKTPDRIPLSDWHETTTGKHVGFQARSVVGGYYMKVLKDRMLMVK